MSKFYFQRVKSCGLKWVNLSRSCEQTSPAADTSVAQIRREITSSFTEQQETLHYGRETPGRLMQFHPESEPTDVAITQMHGP